jgi:hypothetical protein
MILKLSDAVTWPHGCCMHHTGDKLRNSSGPKVLWISVAAASVRQDTQLAVC